MAERLMGHALTYDLTELPGLDDLFASSGPIERAQALAAEAFGSDRAFFLVGGASAGVVAALWSALSDKDVLALARTSHRSAVSALLLSGATPLWIRGSYEQPCYVPMPVSAQELLVHSQRESPDCLLVTSPTYEGFLADPAGTAEATAAQAGLTAPALADERPIMIVDEAHGGHMYFLPATQCTVPGTASASARLNPTRALEQDMDACIHGAHKTLGSLTGTGLLHLKGRRLDPGRVNQALLTIQTSSPSYLMMASLDLARRDMVMNGRRWLAEAVAEAGAARQGLTSTGIEFCCADRPSDPTRLIVGSAQFGMTGRGLFARLREEGVQAEQAGLLYVLFVFSIGDSPGSGRRLVEVLTRIQMSAKDRPDAAGTRPDSMRTQPNGARTRHGTYDHDVARATGAAQALAGMDLPVAALTPRQGWIARWREVPFSESVGRVAAESIFLYPPGAALLVAGEIIPPSLPELVKELHLLEADFQGPADLSMATLRVVEG
jgi:lysine decarboxylase